MPVILPEFKPLLELEFNELGVPSKATVYQEYRLVLLPMRMRGGDEGDYRIYQRGAAHPADSRVIKTWVSKSTVTLTK